MREYPPLKRGDRVRSKLTGREGTCDNDESVGGFVAVRWDGDGRGVLFNRNEALDRVATVAR